MRNLYQVRKKILIISFIVVLIALGISMCVLYIKSTQAAQNNSNTSVLSEENLQSEVYKIERGYISRILPETTLRDLKNNLDNENIGVYKTNNTLVQDTEFIGTGMKLVYKQKEYKLAVVGDLNGDGKAGITDLTQMKLSSVGLRAKPVNEYAKAGDINNDGKISITDLTKMNLATVNLIDIIAPVSFTPEVVSTKDTITVLGETADSNSGVKEYWFEINNNGWVSNTNKLNNKYTFTGLNMETKYTVRMKVVDNAGNTKITKRVEVETLNEENANISIVASTTEWTNQSILVAINFNSNVAKEKKEISVDNGRTWEEYTDPITVEKNMKIKARVVNSKGEVLEEQEKTISNIDKLLPKEFSMSISTTNNTITVGAFTEDANATTEYGKSEIKGYEYTIVNGMWQSVYTTSDTTHTFNGITPGVEYTIKVKAIDNAGNERVAKNSDGNDENGEKIKITPIDDLVESAGGITIIPSTEEWTNQNITVTATYPNIDGLTKEISIDNGISWKTYNSIETIQANTIVKARMKDNVEQTSTPKELKITNMDKLAPKDFEISGTATSNSITVNVKTEDEEETEKYGKSGIRGYQFKINNEEWTDIQESGIYTFSNLKQGTNYKVRARAIDNAGNITNANQDGSVDGITIPTPTIDDILEELEETGKIGSIKIKQNIEEHTNTDVVIEVIYPEVNGLIKEVKIGNEDWRTYTETFKVSKNTTIQARLADSTGQTSTPVEKEITNIDKLAPKDFEITGTATTNSITINVGTVSKPGTTDAEATEDYACSGIKEYKYTIINGFWKWTETSTSITHTFSNLMQGKTYTIRVTAVDNAGNEKLASNSDTTLIQTNTSGQITISADKTSWTKENVIVTVTYPNNTEELTRQISIDDGKNWQDYTNISTDNIIITENTVVRAKLMDGKNQIGKEISYPITIIDKLPPKEFTISETVTATTIQISGSTSDAGSGIEGYYFSKDNGVTWQTNSSNKQTNGTYKYESLTPATTYNMKIKVIDLVGNERIVEKQVTTHAKYILTIDANGGTYSGSTTISQAEGTEVTISNPTRTGYTFGGWTLTGAGTLNGTRYKFGTGAAKLTAKWTAIDYTLTFDANGGTSSKSKITAHYQDSITLPTPTRTHTVTYNKNDGTTPTTATANYTFGGWYTSATGGTRATYTTMPAENKTLYAHWSGGSVTLPTPTRSGYTFGGWYSGSACTSTQKVGNAGDSYSPTSDITLYAKWTINPQYVYKDGEEYTSITGGWSTYSEYGQSVTKGSTYVEMKQTENGYSGNLSGMYNNKAFEGYTTMEVECYASIPSGNYNIPKFGYRTSNTSKVSNPNVGSYNGADLNLGYNKLTFDISGSKYIGIYPYFIAYTGSYVRISSIKLY